MTPQHRPRPSISLPGILVVSIVLGVSGPAAAGPGTWTGGYPGLAAPATTMIATDPSNPSVVYAAFDFDLYRSADGGRTWTRLGSLTNDRLNHVLSLFVSPAAPSVMFVGSSRACFDRRTAARPGLWRSLMGSRPWPRSRRTPRFSTPGRGTGPSRAARTTAPRGPRPARSASRRRMSRSPRSCLATGTTGSCTGPAATRSTPTTTDTVPRSCSRPARISAPPGPISAEPFHGRITST